MLLQEMQTRGIQPSPDTIAYIRGLYDAGIRTLDRELGQLFAALDERGLFQNSVVVITADHGENFYEHGLPHHQGLWDESIRVPLLVRTPAVTRARRVGELVSLADVAPTLLDYCHVPAVDMEGSSLLGWIEGTGTGSGPGFALLDSGGRQFGIRTADWKLVHSLNRESRELDSYLFDLREDPGERHNLFGDPATEERRLELQAMLDQELARARESRKRFGAEAGSVALPETDRDQLQALGYAGYVEGDEP